MRYRYLALAALTLSLVGCGSLPDPVIVGPSKPATPTPSATVPAKQYAGVTAPNGMDGVEQFAAATGTHPNIVSYYAPWYKPFNAKYTASISAYGALPVIFLDTGKVPVGLVATSPDAFLTEYARAVAAYKKPIALSLDSEFNGPWWAWSYKKETPAQFVTMWRKAHDIFQKAGATNVTWVWTVAQESAITTPLDAWYPGDAYVDWVGINAYYTRPNETFDAAMGQTLADTLKITGQPVLVTETGANSASNRAKTIPVLLSGIKADSHIVGYIYFDYAKWSTHDWRIDGDAASIEAFRAANHIKTPGETR